MISYLQLSLKKCKSMLKSSYM